MTTTRRSTAAAVAVLVCCCGTLFVSVATSQACRAEEGGASPFASGYGLSAIAPMDVTGALMRFDERALSGLSALNSANALDPLADLGFRSNGRRVDWSRLPAAQLLRGLIRIGSAGRTRLGMRTNFYRADEGHLTAGFVYQRGMGGVGMNWSF